MAKKGELQQLLALDLALVEGLLEPHEAAAALIGFWDKRDDDAADLLAEAARISGKPISSLDTARQEADRLLAAANGDATSAFAERGGVSSSVLSLVGMTRPELTQHLSIITGALRTNLRVLPDSRYAEFSVAGEGGMGLVYWALDTELNRQVAFKVVRANMFDPTAAATPPDTPIDLKSPALGTAAAKTFDELRARFLQEAWITSGLEHPSVVPVYELGQTSGGVPYYTMRFVRGSKTLADAIDETRSATVDARLKLLEPFLKLCDAISYAHSRQVVHRDLKPANVALGEFGEVVVLDWGLARVEGSPDGAASEWHLQVERFRETIDLRTLGALGTPGYMSPEAAKARLDSVDAASDVYSLGIILFEILTGTLPRSFRSFAELLKEISEPCPLASEIDSRIPDTLALICDRALRPDQSERIQSVSEFSSELRNWLAEHLLKEETQSLVTRIEAELAAAEASSGEARTTHLEEVAPLIGELSASIPKSANEYGQRAAELKEQARNAAIYDRRRQRRSRLAVLSLLLLALAGGGYGLVYRGLREDTAVALRQAQSLGLTNAAEHAQSRNQARALLLAMEAVSRSRTADSVSALRTALENHRELDEPIQTNAYRVEFVDPATVVAAGTSKFWIRRIGRQRTLSERAPYSHRWTYQIPGIQTLAASPQGDCILMAYEHGIGELRFPSGELITILDPPEGLDWSGSLVRQTMKGGFSPDGQRLFLHRSPRGSAGKNETGDRQAADSQSTDVYRITGERLFRTRLEGPEILDVAWSRSGQLLAVNKAGSVYELTFPAPRLILSLPTEAPLASAQFSPDATEILVELAGTHHHELWSIDRQRKIMLEERHRLAFVGVQGAIARSKEGEIEVLDTGSLRTLGRYGSQDGVVLIATDGTPASTLAVAWKRANVLIWMGSEPVATLPGHSHPIRDLAVHRSSRRLATLDSSSELRIWRLGPSESLVLPSRASTSSLGSDKVASSSLVLSDLQGWSNQLLYFLDPPGYEADSEFFRRITGLEPVSLVGWSNCWRLLGVTSDGRAAFTDRRGTDRSYIGGGTRRETAKGEWPPPPELRGDHFVVAATFLRQKELIATGSTDMTAKIWGLNGECHWTLESAPATGRRRSESATVCKLWSLDKGRILATLARDGPQHGFLRIWDVSAEPILIEQGFAIAFAPHPTGRQYAIYGPPSGVLPEQAAAPTLRWRKATSTAQIQLGSARLRPDGLDLSPDGLLGITEEGSVFVWNRDASFRCEITAYDASPVVSASFSPTGKRIITVSMQGEVSIWSRDGRRQSSLPSTNDRYVGAQFSSTGSLVLTVNTRGEGRRWHAGVAELLAEARMSIRRRLDEREVRAYSPLLKR